MKRIARPLVIILALSVIAVSIFHVQYRLSIIRDESWFAEKMSYLPANDGIKHYLLGFDTAFASYLWIQTMLYFGSHFMTDKEFPWLIHMVDIVTRLNPRFYPAYEFAGLLIPDVCRNPDASRVILGRGVSALGRDNWKPAFYLGWLHYRYYDDMLRAAEYLALASRAADAPPFVARLTATFYDKAGRQEDAVRFLQILHSTAESPQVRDAVGRKLEELL